MVIAKIKQKKGLIYRNLETHKTYITYTICR